MAKSRLFVGWRVPEGATEELAKLGEALRDSFERAGGHARWEERTKLHATLHFLGEVDDAAIPALGAALTGAVSRHSAFDLRFDGVGSFPARGAPRILFASVGEGAASLVALAGSIQDALVQAGAPRPDKPFHAHVTMARVQKPPRRGWAFAGPLQPVASRVDTVALYRSVRLQTGATHTALVSAALA